MVESDDEIKVLGEINLELESGTNKLIEKLSQEKDSQEEALEEFNLTLDNVLEKLSQKKDSCNISDFHKDRAAVRAKIEVLRSERPTYEQEGIQTREALARSEAYYRALEARVAVLKTHARRLEWQRQAADDLANLKVRDNNIPAYTNRFQELALICTKFVSNETEKVDKYINGLPNNIYGNVKSSKPKTLDETIELSNDLMDQKLHTYTERKSDSKRKADDISRNNQQPFKKQNVTKAYNLGSAEKKTYEGNAPKCTKCQRNHSGPCTLKCHKCDKIGHYVRDCRSTGNTNATNNRGGNGPNPRGNGCFECGNPGHFKRDCPKLNNKNGG
nr:hypothetical protein [Tanacetum cinerariifolium]